MKFHFPFSRRAEDSAPYLSIPFQTPRGRGGRLVLKPSHETSSFIPPTRWDHALNLAFFSEKAFPSNDPADFSDELSEDRSRQAAFDP